MVDFVTHGQPQLVPDLVESIQLSLHLGLALLPETSALRLLECDSCRFLQRTNTREANPCVCCSNVLDQVLRSDQVADSPASSVEELTSAADGQRESRDLGAQRRNPGEGHVVELIVNLIGKNENVLLDAKVADGLELLTAEDLTHRVVRCVDHNHACALRDLALQLLHVKCPFTSGSGLCCAVRRRVQRHVNDLAARHLDVGNVLVEEGLEDNDLVAGLEEAHEGGEHALVGAGGDSDFGLWVDGAVESSRVGFCDCFLQARATLLGAISWCLLKYMPNVSYHTFVGEYWLHSTLPSAS